MDKLWYLYSRIFNNYLCKFINKEITEEEFNLKASNVDCMHNDLDTNGLVKEYEMVFKRLFRNDFMEKVSKFSGPISNKQYLSGGW